MDSGGTSTEGANSESMSSGGMGRSASRGRGSVSRGRGSAIRCRGSASRGFTTC